MDWNGNISWKTNDMARIENTWCKENKIERIGNISCNTNEISRIENTSCYLKQNGPNWKYFM